MEKRILVCVKLVPGSVQVEMDGQFRLKRDGAKLQLNIADLSALEAGLRLKGDTGSLTVLSMGPAKGQDLLQELYALGADRVVLLSDRVLAGADSFATAGALAAAVKFLGGFDCILCGRRAIDGETGQIPGQLAAALEIPAVTNAESAALEGERLVCRRHLEDGVATVSAEMPCLLSLCEYVYPLRLPSILGRRRAKTMSVEILTAAEIGLAGDHWGSGQSKTQVVSADSKAPGLRQCRYWSGESLGKLLEEVTG